MSFFTAYQWSEEILSSKTWPNVLQKTWRKSIYQRRNYFFIVTPPKQTLTTPHSVFQFFQKNRKELKNWNLLSARSLAFFCFREIFKVKPFIVCFYWSCKIIVKQSQYRWFVVRYLNLYIYIYVYKKRCKQFQKYTTTPNNNRRT